MSPCVCEDCGAPYETLGLDVVLPDDQWEMICPGRDGGGILCGSCIAKRAEKLPCATVIRAYIGLADSPGVQIQANPCPKCGCDVDEHPADRCLDAWVAEEVMGWHSHGGGHWWDADDKWCAYAADIFREFPWRPSISIADAWDIVERFRCGWQGHAAACIDIKISDWVCRPDCQAIIFAPDIADVKAEAYSPCLAICRAALKAASNKNR